MEQFLKVTEIIDWTHPLVASKAKDLSTGVTRTEHNPHRSQCRFNQLFWRNWANGENFAATTNRATGCLRADDTVVGSQLWGQAILRKYIRPAAQKVGIRKQFEWYTFRHTYSTLLRSVGTEFKAMQELLRHSSFRSTLDVYTQAISPAKHVAQAAVLALVFTAETNTTGSIVNAAS